MMEKKQSFFSALKEEVMRGLSPAKSRSESPARSVLRRRKGRLESIISRSGSFRPAGEALAPLMEGPDSYVTDDFPGSSGDLRKDGWGNWVRCQLSRAPSISAAAGGSGGGYRRSDIRLLLGVMGAPLVPIHVSSLDPFPLLSIKDTSIESSSAQYILHQFMAASGGLKLQTTVRNSYAMGKLKMTASEYETATKVTKNRNSMTEPGGFVLWKMNPDMWYVELAVGGSKVHAGSNGKIVWRHTPWLGVHAAKGPARPLRRALQGLDPLTTASMFASATCIGEKKIAGEDCFILKLASDSRTLKARSEGTAEIIRHVLFGYFSQKTGLLVHMEDSHLTRIQSTAAGGDTVYWETTINSFMDDYRPVDGIMIAHSGRTAVTLFRFGEEAMSHSKTRMEESWTIEEVAFNIPGLSSDCFIPPADIKCGLIGEANELPERAKSCCSGAGAMAAGHRSKVAALERSHD